MPAHAAALTDRELMQHLEAMALDNAAFNHRGHVRAAWAYLRDEEAAGAEHAAALSAAADRMGRALLRFATSLGRGQNYHETLTRFWIAVIVATAGWPLPDVDGETLIASHPELLDKDLPLVYYSRERLFSDEARRGWIAPDRRTL